MGQAVMEHGLHSIVVFIVLYFGMTMAGQSKEKACTRSAVLTALAFVYMVAFGHNLPSQASLNPSLKF